MSQTHRDEVRIKYNLNRLIDARSDYHHLAHRAAQAKAAMEAAVADLKVAGGFEEAERIMGPNAEIAGICKIIEKEDVSNILTFESLEFLVLKVEKGFGSM